MHFSSCLFLKSKQQLSTIVYGEAFSYIQYNMILQQFKYRSMELSSSITSQFHTHYRPIIFWYALPFQLINNFIDKFLGS